MLRIEHRRVGDVMILDVKGEIYAGSPGHDLGDTVRTLLRKGYRKVLLNLAEASAADASGISALVGAMLEMRDAGGELKLLHLTKRIKEVLILVALCGYFSTFDSEMEALASFDREPALAGSLVA